MIREYLPGLTCFATPAPGTRFPKVALLAISAALASGPAHAEVFCGRNHPGIIVIRMSNIPKKQQQSASQYLAFIKESGEKVLKTCRDKGHVTIVSENVLKQKAAVIFDQK